MKPSNLSNDQSGIVSILIVTILTVTLALIAIGFSRLADRELKQASDRELSAQAYYAAQSGLNDALAYLSQPGALGFPGCKPPASQPSGPQPQAYFHQDISNNSGEAEYSCISINNTPQWLTANVQPGKPTLLKVSASNLQNLFIAWNNDKYTGTPTWLPGAPSLPPEDNVSANTTGVLRVGLYDVPPGATTNDALSGLSRVYYLYPNSGNGSAGPTSYSAGCYSVTTGLNSCGVSPNTNGGIVNGNCIKPAPNPGGSSQAPRNYCNSEIKNLPSPTDTYYLYLTAQYAPLTVTIQGTDSTGQNVNFVNSQAFVDVTGQGSDVIQRIRATVNLGSQYDLPNYAVQSMETLCKNFTIQVLNPTTYGSASPKENPDGSCFAPSGGGQIINNGQTGH